MQSQYCSQSQYSYCDMNITTGTAQQGWHTGKYFQSLTTEMVPVSLGAELHLTGSPTPPVSTWTEDLTWSVNTPQVVTHLKPLRI
ncbi:hypothetical protein O181_089035 [Austropuccinia psidii MF-1]|uniref:Uncharacterized protein n=1 Tax=Austropuccinia psidii MF-1 TaxID=1389203 RepID=A0A9Q3P526_9BASI|nr:hypothetical protein [Austropuccinia psidii MF-1]